MCSDSEDDSKQAKEKNDPELAVVMAQAYNDWHIDEWCAAYPGRFIPLAIPMLWDPARTADEIRRVAKKGYDDLMAALARLPAGLDWRFIHIGGGELSKQIRAEAERLGLSDRIDWRGKQDQTAVVEAMRAADLFVLPSKISGDGDRDGLPNVLMEAASQKLAILSTAVSAIPEFITDGTHGCLVPPGDPEALAGALERMMADRTVCAAMADAAFARLTAEFGMTAGIDRLEARLTAATAPA